MLIRGQKYKLLCKKEFSIGKDIKGFLSPFGEYIGREEKKIFLKKGEYYEVIWPAEARDDKFFRIWDSTNSLHGFYAEIDEDAPRSYAKWFYTIEEMRELKLIEILE